MRRPPELLDGAAVLKVADLSSAVPTNATRHVVEGRTVSGFAGLALAKYSADPGLYLFYCDADWNIVTDTYHATMDEAIAHAEFEFGSVAFVDATNAP